MSGVIAFKMDHLIRINAAVNSLTIPDLFRINGW